MNKLLNTAFDPENFRKNGHQLIDMLADYLQEAYTSPSMKVLPWKDPQDSYDHWKAYRFESPVSFYKDIIESANHLHSPRYMGHQVSPAVPESALAALLASLLKNGSGVFEMSPAGTVIERLVGEEVAKHIGYGPEASGFTTSGGTLANLTAMLTARQEKGRGDVWNDGACNGKQLAVMVSAEAHYCISRAVRIMGLGDAGLVKIPVNEKFQMDVALLEEFYQQAMKDGKQVFAIVGSSCNTSTGAYDDLEAIGAFARKYNLWFHVDGAHGGAAIFSEKHKVLVKGIEQSDSVVIDYHKMMLTAGLGTALIYRNGKDAYKTFQVKAQYLFESDHEEEWYNIAKRSFECTKFMTVLNVYVLLRKHSSKLFGNYVDKTYALAKTFYNIMGKLSDFETPHLPASNIVCFRYFDDEKNDLELDIINKKIRQELIASGDFYIVQTAIAGKLYLRVSLMNPFTETDTLEHLAAQLVANVQKMVK